MKVEELIEEIKKDPQFLSLKNSIANNPYHRNEAVYDHTMQVLENAKKFRTGNFIKNDEAKRLFIEFTDQEMKGLKIKDSILLVALLHDISKGARYKDENGKEQPVSKTNANGETIAPMHEYISSLLAPYFLKDKGLSEEAIDHVCKIIKLHGTFDEDFIRVNLNCPIEQIIDEIKLRAEGDYIEVLFNIYCDCFSAEPYQFALKTIEEIFESPSLYSRRTFYF